MDSQKLSKNPKQIPIFPLGLVLLPEMTLPLHIFEERYKIMINECLKRGETFGIVFFDGQKIHKVGCTARIVEVLKQYDDGRMDIVVQGIERFYMDQTDESRPYLVSDILYIDDIEEPTNAEDHAMLHKVIELLKILDQMDGHAAESDRFADIDLKKLSFVIPGAEGFSLEERQRFLEMTSARERFEKGLKVLEKVIARVKINREVLEIVGSNGNVRAFLANKGLLPLE